MLKTYSMLIFSLLIFTACSIKKPVTWQERILKERSQKINLVYREYGDQKNRTLLFLHGFGESKETWRFVVPRLAQKYHLVLLDLKGFGESPKVEDDAYSVYDHAKIVADFMKEKRLKEVTVVGRSFGGGVALVLALMQHDGLMEQRIERLILINSMAYKQNLPSMLETLSQPIIGYLGIHFISNDWMAQEAYRYAFYNNDLIPKESTEYAARVLGMPLSKYVYLETVEQLIPDDVEQIQRRYRQIVIPTLILWGAEDVSIGVHNAYKLHRDLQKSRLVVLPKVGHMPNEEAPSQVVDAIMKFMEEQR